MNRTDYSALLCAGIEQLNQLPHVSPVKRLKRFVRKNLLGQLVEPLDYIPWPKGCLLFGLGQAGELKAVADFFAIWVKSGATLYTVDDLLAGQAFFGLLDADAQDPVNAKTVDENLKRMMEFLYQHDVDQTGSLPYRPLHKTDHIYADGIGMICPFATEYALRYDDDRAMELAMTQIRNFVNFGYNEKTGLFYHAYRYIEGKGSEKLGALGWGRAMGWIFFGIGRMLELLSEYPEKYAKERKELEILLEKLTSTVLSYRSDEDLYPSAFERNGAPVDTSASAMILYAIRNLENDDTKAAYKAGLEGLANYCRDGKVLQAQSECMGLGSYGEAYDSYPWSVGMTLALFAKES